MKRYFLAILVFSLIGCSSGSKRESQNSDQSAGEAKVSIGMGICPAGIGARAGDQPKMSITTKSGKTIILCGFSFETEFEVYSVSSKTVVSRPIVTYGAVQHVKAYQKGDALFLDEMIYHNPTRIPGFRREITCGAEQCEPSAEKCIFKRPKAIGDLSEIKSYQSGTNKGKRPDENAILHLSDLALAGNKEAQNIFLQNESTLKLDGVVSETFSSTKDTLLKLKNAKCL